MEKARSQRATQTKEWFEAVFQAHWQRVCGLLYRLVGDSHEAEDLALETFWRLHQQPQVWSEKSKLTGWLYRVATNLGYNALRARRRRLQYEAAAGEPPVQEDPNWDPPVEAERREALRQVRRVLVRMKPRAAQILVLRYSGLSYAEIATALGVASTSVGTLLARAEREFEDLFLREEHSPERDRFRKQEGERDAPD